MMYFNPRSLKAARTKLGFSRAKLAQLAKRDNKGNHLAEDTIWRIEAGKREPRANTLAAIASALNMPVDDFFIRM